MARITCSRCQRVFDIDSNAEKVFCPFCGNACINQNIIYTTPIAVNTSNNMPINIAEVPMEVKKPEATENSKSKKTMIAIISVVASLVTVLFVILGVFVITPAIAYNKAEAFLEKGNYRSAITAFAELGDYGNSYERMLESRYHLGNQLFNEGEYKSAYEEFCLAESYEGAAEMADKALCCAQKDALKKASVGDIIEFGVYEQDNNLDNGKETLQWIVLDAQADKKLIITKYAVDTRQYDSRDMYLTWADCQLRNWLNDGFMDEAFSQEHQNAIEPTYLETSSNYYYGTYGGNNTTDNVFLLSIGEAGTYFSTNESRRAEPTAYAASRGADTEYGKCWWLTRTPGIKSVDVCGVHTSGELDYLGCYVYSKTATVRPAMWVSTEN